MSEEMKNNDNQVEQPKKKKGKKWIWAVVVIFVVIAIASAGGGDEEPQQASGPSGEAQQTSGSADVTEPEPQENEHLISAGMYKVGADVPPGEYIAFANGMAYLQVSKDSTGTLDSILTNDNFTGTRYITVSEGQYLELRNSEMLPASEAEPQEPNGNEYPPGMYKVGKDISPGEYKVVSEGGMAYVEVSNSSRGDLDSIVTNSNFEGEKYITVSDGQYIKLNGCTLLD